jgi:hypothetical protein
MWHLEPTEHAGTSESHIPRQRPASRSVYRTIWPSLRGVNFGRRESGRRAYARRPACGVGRYWVTMIEPRIPSGTWTTHQYVNVPACVNLRL